ncbi:hypothetical protein CFP65_5610 [Kitasatospora sp. MMS16-BH015]|uniref:hypothetical protein n=1 Tax=Kitasatospora sp. MMS16-BH015 TaxID=2018025 RepID=UPI000CA2F803|nr:hypothetical protein [Kitasatospora sp. MMS16-BH015]AUG80307.1 hypothetical protein CFP65_5610 [Kitasatospora sp. MMS16-BH015]
MRGARPAAVLLLPATEAAPRPARRAPADRGHLRVADRVLAQLAARAVREALTPLVPGARRPKVTATTSHGTARLTLRLSLPFPADLATLTTTARQAATTQVESFTGTPVRRITILIDHLHPNGPTR